MLKAGTRIGPYEVVAPLGAGGMGEVYRVRDTVLGREVALKTLPDEVARQPERLARLRREGRILASLNHPGIATLYGVDESGGTPILVMELVEGQTLSDRIHRGPLPLKDVLRIGHQVAEALAAAHAKGVLHRDLKPANIRVTPEGRAKVLDFGLARAMAEEGDAAVDSRLPTETSPPSRPGTVRGTAPYMSPEQALGQDVDARTDVWALACVLYEMLTGNRAFAGVTIPEVAAAILQRDPDWDALPESTPLALSKLLRRCLKKDWDERLHDVADAGLEMKELLVELSSGATADSVTQRQGGATTTDAWRRRAWLVAAVVALATAITLLVARARRAPVPADARQPRFEVGLPRGVGLRPLGNAVNSLAVSPDGQRVAFVGCAQTCQIYLRDRREIDARPLPGTEGAGSPFFSPDGRWIGYGADGKLKKVALDTGAVVTLGDAAQFRGGSWGEDGTILFNRGRGGLFRVEANGGAAQQVTKPDPARLESDHRWPRHLPGGRAALFDVRHEDSAHDVAVVDLRTGRTHVLLENAGCPRWAPTGHLLFGRYGILYAAPLDVRRLELTGPAIPAVEGVAMWNSPGEPDTVAGNAYYDVAPEGTLVFSPQEDRLPKRTLVWVDREGRRTAVSRTQQAYSWPYLSPDGRRLAVTVRTDVDSQDAFLLDVERDAWTKIVFEAGGRAYSGKSVAQGWMPDGRRLLLGSAVEGSLRLLLGRAEGGGLPETLYVGDGELATASPDGRAVLFCTQPAPAQWDIMRVPLDGPRKAEPWLATPSVEASPSFSPDGRWVAYQSNEIGHPEVYARPYPGPGPSHLVSTHHGNMPLWSHDGREIFFFARGGASGPGGRSLWSAAVRTSPTFASDPPRKLFDIPDEILLSFAFYDVTPDGKRFVMIEKDPIELRPLGIVIVPNWTAELAARMSEGDAER